MIYKHIMIISHSSENGDDAVHFNKSTLAEALQYYRSKYPGDNGICLASTGYAWRFIGYLNEIIA